MNCSEVTGLISEYLDGELGGARGQEFESHVDACTHCASEVEAMREMLSSLRTLSNQKAPVDYWERIRPEVISVPLPGRHWWQWITRPLVAAPALGAAAVLAAFLVWPQGSVPMASDKKFAPEYSYYIGAHSHLQRQQAFADPDAVFVGAEVQKASLVSDGGQ